MKKETTPFKRKAKLTTEQKQQQIAALEQKLIQLKQTRDSLTRHSEEWERARIAVINVQVRIRSIKRSIETINEFQLPNFKKVFENNRRKKFEDFLKEKQKEIKIIKEKKNFKKAKEYEEQLYFATLRYRYG